MTRGQLVASAAGVALVAATVGGVLGVVGAAPVNRPALHKVSATHKVARYALDLTVVTTGPGAPKFTANGRSSAHMVLPANTLVTVVLKSYDNGPAAPPAVYAKVQGTVGGVIKLDGKSVKAVPLATISHTFTIPGIGLNVPIPAVKGSAKYVTESFEFKTGKAGTYAWQCYAPCGTGAAGWGGPMVTPGQMMGSVKIG